MNIAFCSAEVFPFVKTGGLGDVCGTLPAALKKNGVDVTIFLPRYKTIDGAKFRIEPQGDGVSRTVLEDKTHVYFIENEELFGRDGVYGDAQGDYPDNLKRFQYFCAQVLKVIKDRGIKADIVHCHDWHTGLIPAYLKETYGKDPFFAGTKSILTIHNLAHQGIFPEEQFPDVALPEELFNDRQMEFYGKINLLKAGIVFCDEVSTVSPQYAREILTKQFGCGLEGVLRHRRGQLIGILNGIDYTTWDPATDRDITAPYGAAQAFEGKRKNKLALQASLGLPQNVAVPLFGFVNRLSHQKGIDFLLDALDEFLALDVQVVILGLGDGEAQARIAAALKKYPKKLAAGLRFDEPVAHQIYAGSDVFLMPSRFEPCGLSQMISLRYGTPPIVFKTGGLVDTVTDHNAAEGTGDGFVFKKYTRKDFLATVHRALKAFEDKAAWEKIIANAFAADFSWDHSAREYKKLYQCLLSA